MDAAAEKEQLLLQKGMIREVSNRSSAVSLLSPELLLEDIMSNLGIACLGDHLAIPSIAY